MHRHHEFSENLKGICEETATGVARLKLMTEDGRLRYPAYCDQ